MSVDWVPVIVTLPNIHKRQAFFGSCLTVGEAEGHGSKELGGKEGILQWFPP